MQFYIKLLNANRSYIESELEKMSIIAKNELEKTRLEFLQDGCKTFKLDYITMEIIVRTEDDKKIYDIFTTKNIIYFLEIIPPQQKK